MSPVKQIAMPPLQSLSIFLRWLAQAAMVFALVWWGGATWPLLLVWALYVVWNAVVGVLTLFRGRLAFPLWVGFVIDVAAVGVLLLLAGGTTGPLNWIPVVPGLIYSVIWPPLTAMILAAVAAVVILGAVWLLGSGSWLLGGFFLLAAVLVSGSVSTLARLLRQHIATLQQQRLLEQQRRHQIERERIEAIYNLTTALTSTLNYQRVLDTALDMAGSALMRPDSPTTQLVSAVLLFNSEEQLEVVSARRFTPADRRKVLPAVQGILSQVIEEGEPGLFRQPARDPELGQLVAVRVCPVVYCYPLRTGLDVYGLFLFAHPEETFFDEERRAILDIICKQASIALQNARLFHELEQEKERIMAVQEEARNKLARDLHDGPTQSVAAIAMRVNLARRIMERDPKKAAAELYKIEELARRTTSEIRHMLFTLRPLVLETQGLQAALESMAEKMRETYDQNVIVQVDPALVEHLEMNTQGVIFFLAEEAVNNARKHARAEHIWVRLKPLETDLALLEVEDDGVGFDVQAVQKEYEARGSLGMVNLRERTALLNGVLHIDSAPGKGTRVRVYIPLTEEAATALRHRTV